MAKRKIELSPKIQVDKLLASIKNKFLNEKITTIDGLKIDFAQSWVHLRKSNTEPIIRIYTEAASQRDADQLVEKFIEIIIM